jgi:quinol monooxygenase YgiN
MVLAFTTLFAHPDQRVELVKAGLLVVEQVRAEDGCVSCQLFRDVSSDGTFVVAAEWSSLTSLQRHVRGLGYRKMLALMEISARPCAVSFHTIRRTTGMELVHQVLAEADDDTTRAAAHDRTE